MASRRSHLSPTTSSTVLHPIVEDAGQHLWQEAQDQLYEIHRSVPINNVGYQMDRQYHYATNLHNGHLEGGNSQHNAGFTVSRMESQQVMMERALEVDWREEMSQQIKKLKDDCFSDLMEFDQGIICPDITNEQLEVLPEHEKKLYRSKLFVKEQARVTLNFLLLEKDEISENMRGKFSMYEKAIEEMLVPYRKSKYRKAEMDASFKSQISRGQPQTIDLSCDQAPSDGSSSSHHKQQEPPIIYCFPEKSHGSLQSSPINKLQEDFIPLPINDPGVVKVYSNSASIQSTSPSLVAKQDALKVATLSSDSVKFTLPSPVSMTALKLPLPSLFQLPAIIEASSPCASVKSTLPSPVTVSGVVPAASTCAPVMPTSSENFESVSASQLVDNSAAAAELAAGGTATTAAAAAAVNESEQVNPTMRVYIEDNHHGGAEIVFAEKLIDRPIEAVGASSPAMLYQSANSISTVSMNNMVPHWEIDEFQDWGFFSPGDMDGSWISFDCNASEVEPNAEQNAKDALLDEIRSTNSRLLDTVIRIDDHNGTDAITSRNGGTLVEFSYTAMSLSPDLKLLCAASEMPIILPVKVLVPVDYPRSSPVLVGDQWDEPWRKKMSNILGTAEVSFRHALDELPKPMTVRNMAMVWDDAVRNAMVEFAKQQSGGTFSSMFDLWES